jgi:ATP-dependent DNA helicase DinG
METPQMSNPLGTEASARIHSAAADAMRVEIDAVGGREVFFAGAPDEAGLVVRVRVCARGHEGAVPAVFEALQPGEVVLHNHPSGDLSPSDEDLDVASVCGHHGHGCYIVDNTVTRVYVMVEPFLRKDASLLDVQQLARAFLPSSRLAKALPQFEVRPQQTRMMETVSEAFNSNGIAVVEAPTGVGKTLAYLLPAALWAVGNRERVVVSTRTINLQEQIMYKDIPVLQRCLDEKFSAVLVKGRGNYVCLRRFERTLSEATLFEEEDTQETLRLLSEWLKKTEDGSLSDLPFVPKRDLWERVCSEADTCAGPRCPSVRKCFFTHARREVAKADLLVVNHHMLFSDIAIKKELGNFTTLAVLPAYKRVIFDEAHNIEDSATEYFGVQATRLGTLALLGRFLRVEHGKERGLIPYILVKITKEVREVALKDFEAVHDLVENQLLPSLAAARDAITTAFDALRSLTADKCRQIGRDVKWRLTPAVLCDPDLRNTHATYVQSAVETVSRCAEECTRLHTLLKRVYPDAAELESPLVVEMAQLAAYRDRLVRVGHVLAEGTSEELDPKTVRWIEIDAHRPAIVRIARCPLGVGEAMAECVYRPLSTVVMTSATLAVRQCFDYLFSRIGLDLIGPSRLRASVLETPFDFQSQAALCIPSDVPVPDDRQFLEECVDVIRRTLAITQGHAFVLFTSFYALDFTYKRLEQELRETGITPLKQGGAARTQLLNRFRSDASSVLFATDSFWEGVDVAGEALQCVILPKLPFRVPTDPVLEARAEAIELAGGNPFMEYTVPQAVIKFRQGFGRLIRRTTDRGAIVVLDSRILTRHYGRVFLESLPGVRVVSGPRDAVYAALRKFFGKDLERALQKT